MICATSCVSFHGTARRTQNPSHIDSWRRRICYSSIQRWAAAFQSIAARRFVRSYSDHIASSIAWITNRRLSRLRACGTQRAALPRSNQEIEVSPQKVQRFLASDTDAPQNSRLFACFAGEKRRSFREDAPENFRTRRVRSPNPKRARRARSHRTSNIKNPDHAARKRTTFFFATADSASFFGGRNVSSRYLTARSTRCRLQFMPSLDLMFSRCVSIVFTLRFRQCAICLVPSPDPSN